MLALNIGLSGMTASRWDLVHSVGHRSVDGGWWPVASSRGRRLRVERRLRAILPPADWTDLTDPSDLWPRRVILALRQLADRSPPGFTLCFPIVGARSGLDFAEVPDRLAEVWLRPFERCSGVPLRRWRRSSSWPWHSTSRFCRRRSGGTISSSVRRRHCSVP